MSDNWFYEYFINEAKSIIRPGSCGGSVPKPLTYDYMPEGYPSKAVQTTTLMEEQEVAFASEGRVYAAQLTEAFAIAEGQTYTVNWDGTEYECVCSVFNSIPVLGNLHFLDVGDDTGEPFLYPYNSNQADSGFITFDTSASHTISVKTVTEVITPMAEEFTPLSKSLTPDWNQNDETAPDYVKNRPFYTAAVETVFVEESTVAFTDTGSGFFMASIQSTFEATVGETFKVTWDGTVYEVACMKVQGIISIGNLSIIGEGSDTGEPFIMAIVNGQGIQIMTADTSASHTISISGVVDQIVKIDPKYLYMPFKPTGKSYLTFSSLSSFTLNANKYWDGTLEYFASDRTWTTWEGATALSAVYDDCEYVLYLRGTGNTVITQGGRWTLTGSDIACIGNIENLLDYAMVESGNHPPMANNCYNSMFYGCTSLTQAPALPATTLASVCYQSMFYGCTSLTQAPALPATTLASDCYRNMFYGCTSLTQAPALPATTLASDCYNSMFYGCTSLTQAPALPATTLASDCYNSMFYGCTSLTQAPALPATTLASVCYQNMFYGCTSLTQAPALPATTLENYCYNSMFYGCTSLTQAPALPATTLASVCYQNMFYGCTSLTQAPALPATTLENYCYNSMFYGCTSLKLSSTQTDKYTQEYRIPSSGEGTTLSNALTNMFTSTGGTFTGTPSINTTYYLSSDNMIVRETEIATLNGYVGSMINNAISEHADTAEYIIHSSTEGSTKKFKITVDDTGTISATEVT